MSDRILAGEPRLDEILGGGLPPNAINLIMGLPGSGKTILAQQYLFANATRTAPGLYLTTVSEPLEKVLRYGQTLEFFDATAVSGALFGRSPVMSVPRAVGRCEFRMRTGMFFSIAGSTVAG